MSGNDFLVFTELEAVADSSKCPSPPNTIPYYLFSSSQAKQGVVCWTTTDPSNVTATYTFL
ncbi:MAG: hypothetical protein HYV40_03125 [Candidatus Levybacteria bacterium]|nr:hypothetical protein [Candidatus Levybacteria bacterium]